MDDRNRDAFERFARRFSGIEAEVGDPPPFVPRRGAMGGVRRRPRALLGATAGVVALVVMVAVLGPRLADRLAPGPVASAPGTAVSAGTPAVTGSFIPSVAPTPAPTPDPFAGLGPAVFCGRIGAVTCDATVALVRAGYPAEVAAARAVVMDDSCPPPGVCDRFWAFDTVVVLVPRSGGLAGATWFSVHGRKGPEGVSQVGVGMPDFIATLTRSVADAPVATVGDWSALCVDVDLETCKGVAALALNNLARYRASGVGAVTERRSCPAGPDWADTSRCWQVRTPVNPGETVCAVIAKRPTLGGYGQIAGDSPGRPNTGNKERGCPADFIR